MRIALFTSTAKFRCVRRGLWSRDVSRRKATRRRAELKHWSSAPLSALHPSFVSLAVYHDALRRTRWAPNERKALRVHAASVLPHHLSGTIYHDISETMTLVVNNSLAIWRQFCLHGPIRQRSLWERLFKRRFINGLTYLLTYYVKTTTSATKPEVHNVSASSSEEDRATAAGNMFGKFREVWTCVFTLCPRKNGPLGLFKNRQN